MKRVPPILTIIRGRITDTDQAALRTAGWVVVEVNYHTDVQVQGTADTATADAAVELLQEIVSGTPQAYNRDTLALRWLRGIRRRHRTT